MATIIDSLLITLGVDSKGVKSGMARTENIISSSANNIINNILAPLATALALGASFKSFIDNASSVHYLSVTLNENAEDIGAWGEAVARTGGTVEGFQGSLVSLNSKMLEFAATGTSSIVPALSQLGINARNSNGSLKSSIDILEALAKTSTKINPARFQALASSLGLDQGTIMLLKEGSITVEELVAKQKLLGVYTKEDGQIAVKMGNAFKDLIQVLKSLSTIIMRFVIPPLRWLTDQMIKFVMFIKEHKVFLYAFITGLALAISAVLIPAMIRLGVAALANPLTWIFIAIITIVVLLAAVIEDLYVYINGGTSALSGFWSIFGTGEEVGKKISVMWEKLKGILKSVGKTLLELAPIILKVIGAFLAVVSIIKVFSMITAAVLKIAGAIKVVGIAFRALSALFISNPIGAIIFVIISALILLVTHFDTVKKWAGIAADYIVEKFLAFKEVLLSIGRSILEFFQPILDIISTVKDGVTGFLDGGLDTVGGLAKDGLDTVASFFGFGNNTPTATDSIASNVSNSSNVIKSNSSVSVGTVNIETKATDAKGIGVSIGKEIVSNLNGFGVMANAGIGAK